MANDDIYLALDVGARRIGVARAQGVARIASPLKTLENNDHILTALQALVTEQGATCLVIGLPRGLDGQETQQTAYVRSFAETLDAQQLPVQLYFQDEALTSVKAEAELRIRGVRYNKEDVDALAATFILSDFLARVESETHEVPTRRTD